MARDWINTPACGFRSGGTGCRGARSSPSVIGAAFREWVGEELLRGEFPGDPRRRAREQRVRRG